MSKLSSNLELVRRVRKKLETLEQTCMSRYRAREQRIMYTLNFCLNALEQMKNWAIFAIFPQDEQQSEKYVSFVEQRFQCVIGPLRLFVTAVEKDTKQNPSASLKNRNQFQSSGINFNVAEKEPRQTMGLCQTLRQSHIRHYRHAPNLTNVSTDSAMHAIDSRPDNTAQSEEQIKAHFHTRKASRSNESSPRVPVVSESPTLKVRISQISHQYLMEGTSIKDAVIGRLHKCQKDTNTLYKWSQASLLDLHDVVDESLADELYFMVRGKMARILSTISIFEEAAEQIEKTLSSHFPVTEPVNSTARSEGKEADYVSSLETMLDLSQLDSDEEVNDFDLRIEIPETESPDEDGLNKSRGAGVTLSGDLELSQGSRYSGESTSHSESTPEPPFSPRPGTLVNHPKIIKLQTMTISSKFSKMDNTTSLNRKTNSDAW